MTTNTNAPTIILIPGHWLGAWAWDEVLEYLTAMGRPAIPLTLPGLDNTDPDRASRTVDDQATAIQHTAATVAGPIAIVAHSGANVPVTLVLDRYPELIRRVIWVDSGPAASGSIFAPDTPEELNELPLPPFEVLGKQASLEGLNADVLERFRLRAVPEPGQVLRQSVHLNNDARLSVPATLVCCSISSTQVTTMVTAGHPMFTEIAGLKDVEFVDLPTGHWPMWSRPSDLAQVIAAAASPLD